MITILAFGKIAEIAGKQKWEETDVENVAMLEQRLRESYPQIEKIPVVIAVNKIKAKSADPVPSGAVVAVLPPFSGG